MELNDFCMLVQIHVKMGLKIFGLTMVKSGCDKSYDRALKLTVSEEWTDGLNWFFPCYTDLKKFKPDKKSVGWAWSKMGVTNLVMVL